MGRWEVTEASVRQYLQAVGDSQSVYNDSQIVPPLALAAHALGVLLERLALPPGAIHSLQEMEILKPVSFGEEVSGTVVMERIRRRGDLRFITAGYTLVDRAGEKVITGKSTVLVPGAPSP